MHINWADSSIDGDVLGGELRYSRETTGEERCGGKSRALHMRVSEIHGSAEYGVNSWPNRPRGTSFSVMLKMHALKFIPQKRSTDPFSCALIPTSTCAHLSLEVCVKTSTHIF
jgi:hypothetical protein